MFNLSVTDFVLLRPRAQDKPKEPKAYNIKAMAGDLRHILDQVLGEDWKIVVVGYLSLFRLSLNWFATHYIYSHDWGSFFAQRFVGYHGHNGKVLALILYETAPTFPAPSD